MPPAHPGGIDDAVLPECAPDGLIWSFLPWHSRQTIRGCRRDRNILRLDHKWAYRDADEQQMILTSSRYAARWWPATHGLLYENVRAPRLTAAFCFQGLSRRSVANFRDCLHWARTRNPILQVHRREAAIEITVPGSCRWPTAAPGHIRSFEMSFKFQSLELAGCPVSGEQFDPYIGRAPQ